MSASFLDSLTISEESINGPFFGIIYGPAGVGKTFLCKHAEKPFFIAVEKGVEKVFGVGKFLDDSGQIYLPKNEDEFFLMLGKFCKKGHDYKTIVIDSGMFVDKLFIESIIEKNPKEKKGNDYINITSIGDYNYGKGFEKLLAIWETRFFTALKYLHQNDISVILIAHSREKTTRDENGDEFKKRGIDMAEFGRVSIPNVLSAKADFILYMHSEMHTKKKLGGFGGNQVVTVADGNADRKTIVYTRGTSAFDAKVRTEKVENVQDSYEINITDESTSKKLFEDLMK